MNLVQTLKNFYRFAKPYRKQFILGILALLVVDTLNVFPPLILKSFIDQVVKNFSGNKDFLPFLWLGIIFISIALGQGICRYLWRMFLIRGSFNAAEKLREEYFTKLQKLPPSFYDRNPIGDLMSLATNDVEAIRFALGPGLLVFVDAVFFLISIPPAMFFLSPKLACIALAPMIVVPLIITQAEKLIHHRFEKVQAQFSKLSAFAQENIEGIKIIKSFAREWTQLKRFSREGETFIELNLKLAKAQSIFEPLFTLAVSLGLVSLLIFAGKDVIEGYVSLGTFVAFTRYLDQLVWPMMAFGLAVTYYQRGKTSLERILNVFGEKEEEQCLKDNRVTLRGAKDSSYTNPEKNSQSSITLSQSQPSSILIEAKNLTFKYPGEQKNALQNVSFQINKSSRVALVGPIGSGKSTLIRLLLGLYEVPSGMLFWNGIDLSTLSLNERREKIAVVPQEVFLFRESLEWNILMGSENQTLQMTDAEFKTLLKKAGLEKESAEWQKDFTIGERGLTLSGGQRARVSLARALIREVPLLILDDALSSVDVQTETEILNGLSSLSPEQTLIMITHRFTRLSAFDQVLVLKEGSLVQAGSPQELSEQEGLFKELLELQRLEDELARG